MSLRTFLLSAFALIIVANGAREIATGNSAGSSNDKRSSAPLPAKPVVQETSSPAPTAEKPEPTRPTAGQEVGEAYFDWINRKMGFECQQQIKSLVRNDMRSPGTFSGMNSMESLFFVLRFDRWSKHVANDGTIRIHGDKAEAQNGMGNWMRVKYSCTVNINTKTVTDASLDNGRIN